ncbi:hypothetical protein [Azorhizophilus paspali]|uniref:Photosynthesis system II assembly factor Ycf48/Hcf136-like domain-containing protein n=1 Tax=Azorhizophilus paspali TaxID=69963 RepID=A0ABV6SFZ2_AZOPA
MAINLKSALGGNAVPIGGSVYLADRAVAEGGSPLVEIDGAEYLRSGYLLVNEEANYPKVFENFVQPNTDRWQSVTNITAGFTGLAYGNGRTVAVSSTSGKYAYSDDGINWTAVTGTTAGTLLDVAFGNGVFVAIGQSGKVVTSPDGITWTVRTSGFSTSDYLNRVIFAKGLFVALGKTSDNRAEIRTSEDGVTWTSRYVDESQNFTLFDVCIGEVGALYAIGYNDAASGGGTARMCFSVDGLSWTGYYSSSSGGLAFSGAPSSGAPFNLVSIVYHDGLFVAASQYGYVWTSIDGFNWTYAGRPTSRTILRLTYLAGLFWLVGLYTVLCSIDGKAWSSYTGFATAGLSFRDMINTPEGIIVVARQDGGFNTTLDKQVGFEKARFEGSAVQYMRVK